MKSDATSFYATMPLTVIATAPAPIVVADDDADSAMPADLRSWLVRLRLLEGVPFANLVADTALLPEESIRWFYLDRRWTDALVQGALSAGTVNSDDRAHLEAQYPAVRAELDTEERNVRRRPGTPRWGGRVEAVSGFVLRSRAVSGWPGLHVRAFSVDPPAGDDAAYADKAEGDPDRLRLLRLERLAPAVLFCLFDGIPKIVHIEEPRQGIQFGFDDPADAADPAGPPPSSLSLRLRPRNRTTFDYLPPRGASGTVPAVPADGVTVPFRSGTGGAGVVDIEQLERTLRAIGPETGADAEGLDSAEYALQAIRFPFRQVWGDPAGTTLTHSFSASIAYADLARSFQTGGP